MRHSKTNLPRTPRELSHKTLSEVLIIFDLLTILRLANSISDYYHTPNNLIYSLPVSEGT